VSRGVSPAELRRLYQRERLAPVEIGERFGVSGRTVSGWLRQLGIAPRPGPSAADAIDAPPRRSFAAATLRTACRLGSLRRSMG